MQYFFILGKNPILSKAEIEAVLQNSEFGFQISAFGGKVLVLEAEKELDINWLNNRLGGTVKIGKILGTVASLDNFASRFFELIKFDSQKVFFGFSLYQLDPKVHLGHLVKKLTPVAMEIKRLLREEKNINSRYVVSKELELSSVIVAKNKLLQNGAEICFLVKENEILVGQTLAVQPFKEFGSRDYGRPSRDDVSGMIPPKLARIMVNLAQLKDSAVIADPFCGSGTILQEALLMGYKNIFGFDKSPKAVADSQKNLVWLKNKFNLDLSKVIIKQADALKLSQELGRNSVAAIIAEPYLGPALKGRESLTQINSIINGLRNLYLSALKEFAEVLTKGGKVIIISPIFTLGNQIKKIDLEQEIEKLNFTILNKEPLIYSRPNQHVWRQIYILQK